MDKAMKTAIVGLGYVGLPLSLQFARSGVTVLGLDVDSAKVDALHQGKSYIKHIPSETVAEAVRAGTFSAATDFGRIREVDAIIICVPTPLNKNREPDISYILDTGKSIARHLRKGMLVVLESTTYPGTTDEDLREVLEDATSTWRFPPSAKIPATRTARWRSFPRSLVATRRLVWKRPLRFTPWRSRRSCPCRPAAPPRRRSCSKTPFAV
jgi:3-hydroxyisobutyrate dehydrogenase-like beta-hydroxyacid dehydrogenase